MKVNTIFGDLLYEVEVINGTKSGKIKEYDIRNGKLKFEGECLNGKKNGKGKEYNIGDLIFEGDYKDGYKIKGKEYHNDKLIYEGEYLYDKKWTGKGYNGDSNIIYELFNGIGRMKEFAKWNDLIFEGQYINGERNRKGKEYKNGRLVFEGEYLKRKNER